MPDVLATWQALKADPSTTRIDRMVGAAIVRDRLPRRGTAIAGLAKSIGTRPATVEQSIMRLRALLGVEGPAPRRAVTRPAVTA